jgi:transcriptional regulator with XRE-family HTH domain
MALLTYPEHVRLKMIELRKTRTLSQSEFGSYLGLSYQTVSSLELGRHEWSLTHIQTALLRFELPPNYFNVLDDSLSEETTNTLRRDTSKFLGSLSGLSAESKKALYKYSLLNDEQRDAIDKLILSTAKKKNSALVRAILAILRESCK